MDNVCCMLVSGLRFSHPVFVYLHLNVNTEYLSQCIVFFFGRGSLNFYYNTWFFLLFLIFFSTTTDLTLLLRIFSAWRGIVNNHIKTACCKRQLKKRKEKEKKWGKKYGNRYNSWSWWKLLIDWTFYKIYWGQNT